VISGGPGTGKTTTVAKVLALHIGLNPDVRIMLAAPTGKAATRLEESLAETLGELEIMEAYGALSVQTIHRLLGFSASGFRYNARNLLPADLVLVDEASMVDLPLMADLMKALPPDCHLILLGDAYQLSSVQPGAVLAEIYAGEEESAGGGPVRGIVTLRKSFRFKEDSGIRLLADCIKRGDGRAGLRLLEDENYADVSLIPHDVSTIITSSCQAYAGATPEAVLTGFYKLGVLCCHRSGDFGVEDINTQVMHHLGYKLHQYFHGLPLMILANDHNLRLYNGDTCVVMEEDGRFYACLQNKDGMRMIPVRKLPSHAPAYGITVHKSQGSEYNEVAFLFPPGASQVLGRELVYTAITRARKSVVIYGTAQQFVDAVAHRVVRVSGLSKRLSGVIA
jgi:exodeoxyribonuclease V alpha subunit